MAGALAAGALFAPGPVVLAAAAISLPPGQLPSTIPAAAPFVVTSEVLVLLPRGPAVQADELVVGVNRSKASLTNIALPLPPGAVGAAGGSSVVPGRGGMRLARPVAAGGVVKASFHFVLSYAGGRVWLPVRYPTGLLAVLVPQGQWSLAGPGFQLGGSAVTIRGIRFSGYTTLGPTAGATLPLRLARRPWWAGLGWPVWGPVAGVASTALGWGGLRAWRRRRDRREGEVVDAVANLDAAFSAGEVDESSYRARRQELLEGLGTRHAN